MNGDIREELIRLTKNAALHREELLTSGLRKARSRKLLNILAGILSLLSAGVITAVLANIVGKFGLQVIAALVALLSGTITLVVTSYFSDDEIMNLLNGSSKYLALRESVNRVAVDPEMTDKQRFKSLSVLQENYAKLDETYSRYFLGRHRTGMPRYMGIDIQQAERAGFEAADELKRQISERTSS